MPKTRDFIPRTLAAKIIFKTVFYVAILLAATILAMTIGMRVVIKEEIGRQVDQALEGIACRLDIHGEIPDSLENPQELQQLCLKALEANPDVAGCAIAFNPDYFTEDGKPFMACVHRSGEALGLSDLREAEDPAIMESLQEMVEGKSGRRTFTMNATAYYIAYMPFRLSAFPGRQEESPGWSIAVIYPQKELSSQYDPGFRYSILIILAGILLLIAGAMAVSRISLKPLRKLTYISRRIANGHYLTPILETRRTDEVGRLQNLFYKMQKAISDHMENLQNLSIKEEERRKDLALTYAKTKEAEKYRSAFFSKMTHQMADVTSEIQDNIDRLNESGKIMNENELRQVLSSIEKNALKVNEILGDMLNAKNS